MTSLLKGKVFSSQQMKEANNEVSRLQHFMQFYQFCREKKSQSFSDYSKTIQVSRKGNDFYKCPAYVGAGQYEEAADQHLGSLHC